MEAHIEKQLARLFKLQFGIAPNNITLLPQAGSSRKYFRLEGAAHSAIGTWNPDQKENHAFLKFSRHFKKLNLAVPEIYQVSEDALLYLQQDLGQQSLYQLLPYSSSTRKLYEKALVNLVRLQVLGGKDFPRKAAYPAQKFDRVAMRWDLDYFKYSFLKLQDIPFDEWQLEEEFNKLLDWLMDAPAWHFMLRDCQSRNIFIKNGEPFFIDYQAGREGPIAYDLASLLWQAKAQIPIREKEALVDHYLRELQQLSSVNAADFKRSYYGFALLRTLQVLGAYGLRGIVQRKQHFLESIPLALNNAKWLLSNLDLPFSLQTIQSALEKTYSMHTQKEETDSNTLTVAITSFSYRRGIPEDHSGNGGGYVFDCRPLLNPGRFEPYKNLTGLDVEVQEFLKEKSDVGGFLEPVFTLVDRAVATYIDRGFSHLQVNFGCTGGQHRSVYSAEQLAAHLEQVSGLEVVLKHRERAHWPKA